MPTRIWNRNQNTKQHVRRNSRLDVQAVAITYYREGGERKNERNKMEGKMFP